MAMVTFDPPGGGRVPMQTFGERMTLLPGRVTFSGSYSAGGEAIDFGGWLREVKGFFAHPAGGYVFEYDYETGKLKVFQAGGSAGPLVEVSAGTNLSGVTTHFIAWCY